MSGLLQGAFRTANRPKYDENYMVEGILKEIKLGKGTIREKQGRHVDEREYERCEFYFDLKGITGDPFEICLHTGTVFSDEPIDVKGKSRGVKQQKKIYNRFTTLCMNLELITTDDIENTRLFGERLDVVSNQLANLKNLPVVVKIGKKDGYWVIDPASVSIVKSQKVKNAS